MIVFKEDNLDSKSRHIVSNFDKLVLLVEALDEAALSLPPVPRVHVVHLSFLDI